MEPFEPVHIIHQTEDWAVIYKPAHLLIHPTRPDGQYSLWHWIKEQFPNKDISIINRLDRETSGIVLVSLNKETGSTFGKMTMKREIQKEYLALVSGKTEDEGMIDLPLDKLSKYPNSPSPIQLKQAVLEQGYPAKTEYKRIETRTKNNQTISLLKIKLHTGRLHQIRVHMSHIGHPVMGDKIYGPDEMLYLRFIDEGWTEDHQQKLQLNHHALHAFYLSFDWQGEQKTFEIPLPSDLQTFWDNLL
jgi:23S rRNA pseudouridine1911/1915/1917 synthase